MKKMTKLLSLLMAMTMILGMTACGGNSSGGSSGGDKPTESGEPAKKVEKQYLRITAGPSGGFNYTLFAGIADLVNKEYPGYYDIQVDISTGTSENARNLMMGEAQFGMVGLDVVKDAYDATLAVTQAFAKHTGCLYIISTHIVEVASALEESCGNVRFRCLPSEMEDGRLVYHYKLHNGISSDRHGMTIIRNEHILDILKGSDVPVGDCERL